MIAAVGEHAQGKRLDSREGLLLRAAIGHHPGQLWNLGDPPAIGFPLKFNSESHGERVFGETSGDCRRPRVVGSSEGMKSEDEEEIEDAKEMEDAEEMEDVDDSLVSKLAVANHASKTFLSAATRFGSTGLSTWPSTLRELPTMKPSARGRKAGAFSTVTPLPTSS